MPIDLEFLGKQTERILGEVRALRDDMQPIKMRLTAIESAFGLLITQVATLNNRIDRIEIK
jgi:hypothetical protein